jgi:hypothetical protein
MREPPRKYSRQRERVTFRGVGSPISIRVGLEVKRARAWEEQMMSNGPTKVTQNPKKMAIVNLGGSTNKLAKNVNSIRNVRMGHTQIDKAPNNMTIPSGIMERFIISGTKLKIELHGSLDSAMISEGESEQEDLECTFLGTNKCH